MKVGLSTTMIQGGKSGVAQYVFSLLAALLDESYEHQFHLFVLEKDAPLFDFAASKTRITLVPEQCRGAVRNILWHQMRLPRLARALALDVLHVPSYRRMVSRMPCATVATIHDLAPFHVPGKYDAARMFYGKVVARMLARSQDKIIAVSSNTARDIETFFGIPFSEQHVVLNGIDHEKFKPGERATACNEAQSRWQLHQPFFLYVSRLEHPAKNHVRLIEAYEQFVNATGSNWQLVFGGSDWHGADVIRAAAHNSAARQNIRFLGFVADEHLPVLYRAAGALVYPSLFEGFGFPPIEAMACGCPVISSDRGSLKEVVAEAAAIIDPYDIVSMASQLRRIAEDEVFRARLISAGLANARTFDWNANARAVLEVYKAAIKHFQNRESP